MKEATGKGGALASPTNTELARKPERVQRAGNGGRIPKQGSARKEGSTSLAWLSLVWQSLVLGRGSKAGASEEGWHNTDAW